MRIFLAILLLAVSGWAQEIKRPTTDTNPGASTAYGCSGTNVSSGSMPFAYDAAGLSTSSTQTMTNTGAGNKYKNRIISTWQTTGNTYSALSLNVNSLSAGATISGAACVKYSADAGATWTNVKCDSGAGWTQQTTTITLSAAQDLSRLQVSVCAQSGPGSPSDPNADSVQIFDIWTLGTVSGSIPVGTGSTAGTPHRGAIFVF